MSGFIDLQIKKQKKTVPDYVTLFFTSSTMFR